MFIKLLLLVCGALYASVDAQKKFRSDYKYHDELGGWLKYHTVPANWNNARIRCFLEGAILASPVTEEMTNVMTNAMKNKKVAAMYTGIHATYSKGDFFSMEGIPLRNIPQNSPPDIDQKNDDEDCLVIFAYGTLGDVRCANVYNYMCFRKFDVSQPTTQNECGTIDNEYSYSEITGHCYKFNPVGETWTRAFMTCAAEGSYLAIINSETEAEVIRELYAKYPNEALIGATHNAHVGYKSDHDTNFWMTIHGQSLKEAGYAYWDSKKPDNATFAQYNGGQNCGNIFRTARFDDNHCDVIAPFICEKHPESLQE